MSGGNADTRSIITVPVEYLPQSMCAQLEGYSPATLSLSPQITPGTSLIKLLDSLEDHNHNRSLGGPSDLRVSASVVNNRDPEDSTSMTEFQRALDQVDEISSDDDLGPEAILSPQKCKCPSAEVIEISD